jgi:hypothetical protein
MWRRCLIITVLFALGMVPSTATSWESPWDPCEQQGLEGVWSAEVWGGCPDGTQCWDQCTLTIGPDGTIQAGDTYVDCLGSNFQIIGGQLFINSKCSVQGTIVTSNGTIDVGPGAIIDDRIILSTEQ